MRLQITIGDQTFEARLSREMAPRSCAVIEQRLPYAGRLIHARWSGLACWSPLAGVWPPGLDLAQENPTSTPEPGQVLIYAGPLSEPELYIPYGANRFACQAGVLEGNPVMTIAGGLDRLAATGQARLWDGAADLLIVAQP